MTTLSDVVAELSRVSPRRVVRLETADLGAFVRALDGTGTRTADRHGFPTCRDVVVTRADVPAGEVWAVYVDESRELVARLP